MAERGRDDDLLELQNGFDMLVDVCFETALGGLCLIKT